LIAKLQAYELQDGGLDTVQANERLGFKPDCREYKLPVAILRGMGVKHVVLMSNNPEKISGWQRCRTRGARRNAKSAALLRS
jgi:GTP cyclohydrolase II